MTTGTVLVVDDNALMREACAQGLMHDGHRVLVASGGEAGAAVLDAEPVDVLITDVRMPGMGGRAFVHWAHQHHPAVRVVVCSGVGGTGIEEADAFLAKPFSLSELLSVVARLLESREEEPAPPC